jgi:hypothetical protein
MEQRHLHAYSRHGYFHRHIILGSGLDLARCDNIFHGDRNR